LGSEDKRVGWENCREEAEPKSRIPDPGVAEEGVQNRDDNKEDMETPQIKCMLGQEKRHVLSQRTDSVDLKTSLVSVSFLTKSKSPDEIGNI
jgi:hypothetical protein